MQGMKTVLLAGGYGTRLSEATHAIPKPMVGISDRSILCHIMRQYAHFGCEEFFIALGYLGLVIKRNFLNFDRLQGLWQCRDTMRYVHLLESMWHSGSPAWILEK